MYILTQYGTQIVDADKVERFCISTLPDCDRIVASYSDERPPVTLARYAKDEDAALQLYALLHALAAREEAYIMPSSILQAEEKRVHDARTKRKGGS